MKFLIDMPVTPKLIDVLIRFGHQGIHSYDLGLGSAPDNELLELATRESMVVVTADLDFSRLLYLSALEGPGLILFRGGNYSDQEMISLLEKVLQQIPLDVLGNSICIVDQKRVRVRRLPIQGKPE